MAQNAHKKAGAVETIIEFDQEAIKRREAEVARETDAEIIARLRERFEILNAMTQAVRDGDVRALIVSGPPGVGKSHGVEAVLQYNGVVEMLADKPQKFEIVKGAVSSIGLYCKLYEFADEGDVVVFDDCDGILQDEQSLNVLKAALDSNERRFINWNKDSRVLRSEGIPDRFEFKGSAIFITNIKFEYVRSKRLREHLNALESRCHYIDMQMDTAREKILRIRQLVEDGMLDRYEMDEAGINELLSYVVEHSAQLRELSARMLLKLADLRKAFPKTWKVMAKTTCMRRGA